MSVNERRRPAVAAVPLPPTPEADQPDGLRSAFTARTVGVFLPTLALLCVWTSYSEGVVSSTSFHSIAPPINIVVVLFLLTAVVVPAHRGLRAGQRRAVVLLACSLVVGFWLAGD